MRYLIPRTTNGDSVAGTFDRMMDDFFNDLPGWNLDVRSPAADVREENDRYILEVELPGMTEKDIDVRVEENLLTVSSKKEEQKEEKKGGYIMKERKAMAFKRSFVLPNDVDKDRIKAKFRNGLLELVIDKKEEAKPRSIEIKVE